MGSMKVRASRSSSVMLFIPLLLLMAHTSLSCGPLFDFLDSLLNPPIFGRELSNGCLAVERLLHLCPEGQDGFSKFEFTECQRKLRSSRTRSEDFRIVIENENAMMEAADKNGNQILDVLEMKDFLGCE